MSSPSRIDFSNKSDERSSQPLPSYDQTTQSTWYSRSVRPVLGTTGILFSEIGGPIMTVGIFHGFARRVSSDYLKSVNRYPSGAVVFLTGLAMRVLGNSLANTYSSDFRFSTSNITIKFENTGNVKSSDKADVMKNNSA